MLESFFVVSKHFAAVVGLQTITTPLALIGRGPNCDVRLTDPHVSRTHALLERRGTELLLSNLSKMGGINYRGLKLTEVRLRDGDEFEIRPYTLRVFFHYDAAERCCICDDETPEQVLIPAAEINRMERELTAKQREVYRELLTKLNEKQIADKFGRDVETIHTHVKAIYKIFHVNSRADLMAKCALSRH